MSKVKFYQGIGKKIPVYGPGIVVGQKYKGVVYKTLGSQTGVIYNIGVGVAPPTGSPRPCHNLVEFTFTPQQTATLTLGENNFCVYDVKETGDPEANTSKTMYAVFEAKVETEDSYANHDS